MVGAGPTPRRNHLRPDNGAASRTTCDCRLRTSLASWRTATSPSDTARSSTEQRSQEPVILVSRTRATVYFRHLPRATLPAPILPVSGRNDRAAVIRRASAAPSVIARTGRTDAAVPAPDASADTVLGDRLRRWRLDTARAAGLPPYAVFHDSTLDAIVAAKPGDRRALASISGIGPARIERWGEAILAAIVDPGASGAPCSGGGPSRSATTHGGAT